MSDVPITATTGISFLAHLLAACDNVDDPAYKDIKIDVVTTDGRTVIARLVTPSGDTYRVTVEWISEDSP